MPRFEDFLDAFSYNPETFNADEFKAAIKSAHDDDIGQVNGIVAERETTIGKLTEDNTRLGSENWKLLMKQGTPIPPNNDSGSHTTEEEEEIEIPTLDSVTTVRKVG